MIKDNLPNFLANIAEQIKSDSPEAARILFTLAGSIAAGTTSELAAIVGQFALAEKDRLDIELDTGTSPKS